MPNPLMLRRGEVLCEEPIAVVSHKLGLCHVSPAGKPCSTTFKRLSFNGRTSVVQCESRDNWRKEPIRHCVLLPSPILSPIPSPIPNPIHFPRHVIPPWR
eukprot:Opistho-2@78142